MGLKKYLTYDEPMTVIHYFVPSYSFKKKKTLTNLLYFVRLNTMQTSHWVTIAQARYQILTLTRCYIVSKWMITAVLRERKRMIFLSDSPPTKSVWPMVYYVWPLTLIKTKHRKMIVLKLFSKVKWERSFNCLISVSHGSVHCDCDAVTLLNKE